MLSMTEGLTRAYGVLKTNNLHGKERVRYFFHCQSAAVLTADVSVFISAMELGHCWPPPLIKQKTNETSTVDTLSWRTRARLDHLELGWSELLLGSQEAPASQSLNKNIDAPGVHTKIYWKHLSCEYRLLLWWWRKLCWSWFWGVGVRICGPLLATASVIKQRGYKRATQWSLKP